MLWRAENAKSTVHVAPPHRSCLFPPSPLRSFALAASRSPEPLPHLSPATSPSPAAIALPPATSPSPATIALHGVHRYSHASGIPPHLHRDTANVELSTSSIASPQSHLPQAREAPPLHHTTHCQVLDTASTTSAKPTSDLVYLQPRTRQVPLRSPRPHPASTSTCTASAHSTNTKNEHAPATGRVWVGCDE
uniref:Uncharacterized protein n=1 Tax=Mycena chlorophos TaxID=658473 RepID=A0ABQ0LA58_MYCCL|nr:predicted protein [Mycena chlorophos]